MKKILLCILLCYIMLLGITGCGENKKEKDISIKVKEGTLTKTSATIIIEDNNGKGFNIYGQYFEIEKKENNKWVKLKEIGNNCAFNLMAYFTDDNGILEMNQDWECMYGKLENGTYRLIKYTNKSSDKVDENKKYFSVEFSINENNDTANIDGKTCEYIRTYRFIDYYDYDSTVLSNFFIIVDQYQMDSPMIIELNNNFKNTNFVKGENYEFTFNDLYSFINTTDGTAISKKTNIVKVEHTDKGGMEQIQAPCILK